MQSQTFNIALPRELVKKIDATAKKEYKNRSELIREAVIRYLKDVEEWEEIYRIGKQAAERVGIRNEKQLNDIVYEYRHGRKP